MSQLLASSSSSLTSTKKINDGETSNPIVFQSNLACVLNDPKKTRAEISTFFTKTWGNSFVERMPDSLSRLGDYTLNDFELYFNSLRQSEKYGRPRLANSKSVESEKVNPIINIPQIFLSSQFTLNDPTTFNLVYPGILLSHHRSLSPTNSEQHTKTRTTSTSSDKSEQNTRRQSTSSTNKINSNGLINGSNHQSINVKTRFLQDKYSHYLDEVEVLISRSLSTKSDCFHDAVRSHDEIQKFLLTTRDEIEVLRQKLANYDEQFLLKLLRLCRLIEQRKNLKKILKIFQYLSIIKQTHIQVENFLKTQDYLSALDFLDLTKEIYLNHLIEIHSLKFYQNQLNELYSFIENLIKQEFLQIINQQLNSSNDLFEEEKISTILISLIRINHSNYFQEIKNIFQQFLFHIIDEHVSLFSKDYFQEKSNKHIQNSNTNLFSPWFHFLSNLFQLIETHLNRIHQLYKLINDLLLKQKKTNENFVHIFYEFYDQIQDHLITIVNQQINDYSIEIEYLTIEQYTQFIKLIQHFIQYLYSFDHKYNSTPLKTFLQNQINKYLTHFHEQRKQRLSNTLDNEQWRQVPIPRSIQNSIDELFQCSSTEITSTNETLKINGEDFVLTNSVLHLFMLILDYCSCSQLLNFSSINDIEYRLIELLNLFNSKTCQLVLGAGAVKLGKIKTISAKILAITCRSLQFIKIILPKIKSNFDQFKNSSEKVNSITSMSSTKQFEQLTKLYNAHIDEIHGKLISIIEITFEDTLSSYEVRAPMPSDCFRTLVTRHITAFYNALVKIVSPTDLVLLFNRLNHIFKQLLAKRLRVLKISNDGGPQHGLLTSDLLYYIKQIQNLHGLEMLELHIDDIWTINS